MRSPLAFLALGFAALPAAAAPALPEATYACALDGKPLGSVKIPAGAGSTVATAEAFGGQVKFITMDPDRIEWLGNLAELSAKGYRVDKTVIRTDDGTTLFDITLLTPDQSGYVTATCAPAA